MPKFKIGDEVVVVLVRNDLGAQIGDRGVVYGLRKDCGPEINRCEVRVLWSNGIVSRFLYNNQFDHVGGPW